MIQNEKLRKLALEGEQENNQDKDVYIKKENIDLERDKYMGCLNINGINGKTNVQNEEGKLLL